MIKIIAAVGRNLELGKQGNLIWHLPGDLKFFKARTSRKIVVMGRTTYNSLPKKLPGRVHYVLTDVLDFNKDIEDVRIFYDFNTLLEEVKKQSQKYDVFIIGGASVYAQFIPYADELILTEINAEDKEADAFFPSFNKKLWEKQVLGKDFDGGISYTYVRYFDKKE